MSSLPEPGAVLSRADMPVRIDRGRSASRLQREIETLSMAPFSLDGDGVTRYAFIEPYMRTLDYLTERLVELDFDVRLDPVGNLVARNCGPQAPAVGLGSHCDSVRGGGCYDGMLGVLAAIEVARVGREFGLELPLQIVSWVEEEASGFGQMLLGSRIVTGQVGERELRDQVCAIDDGRSFWEHAQAAGLAPQRLAECSATLEHLGAWIELHIEQGHVLEDGRQQLGVVEAIAGYVHGDIEIRGQADHAGATPMALRRDAAVVAAHSVLELERLTVAAGGEAVGTVGELTLTPGAINAVPGLARLSLDIRAPDPDVIEAVASETLRSTTEVAESRGLSIRYHERQRVAPVTLDQRVIATVRDAATATGASWRSMISGAAHDTMCIAPHVPSAMLFIPCRDGISHSPAEHASTADAALGVEVLVNAVLELADREVKA